MTPSPAEPLLAARGLAAGYGRRPVVRDCDLAVHEGTVVLMMGRNGVGKTTLVSAISGRLRPLAGEVTFDGRRIDRLPAYRRSRLGIAHVPQGREMVASLTVRENLVLAHGGRRLTEDRLAPLFEAFPFMAQRLDQVAGSLSGGEQQMVAIGRALLQRCRLLILDEPSMGLSPRIAEEVFDRIGRLKRSLGLTVLLVEQQVGWIARSGLADHVYVLENGGIALSGTPDEIDEERLQAVYLGGEAVA